jgi:dihydroorotate dehydrogenase
MYKSIIRPLLFKLDPEKAHHLIFNTLRLLFKVPGVRFFTKMMFDTTDKKHNKTVMGLTFKNPIGLAAGFDKDAVLYEELSCLGFGFIEIGTLTPLAQPGNDKPRMFRLPEYKGLINRMGFNNGGVNAAIERLKDKPKSLIIGGNIGKNKATSNDDALKDYEIAFEALHPFVDYFVINVSSPNTPNLRALQDKEPLTALLKRVYQLNQSKEIKRPILLKIAPDLNEEQLKEIIEIVESENITGIIATNTTIDKSSIPESYLHAREQGGLSGLPVKEKSTAIIKFLRKHAKRELVIIAVGGIFTSKDAKEKLDAGADLVQVYTGFIYEGPAMVKHILKGL